MYDSKTLPAFSPEPDDVAPDFGEKQSSSLPIPAPVEVSHSLPSLFLQTISDYFTLTKPSIMLLVIFTGATALFVEGSFLTEPHLFLWVLTGLYLTGGSANALNQFFEREIDAKMTRTQNRRPLPQGKITPTSALLFALTIGVAGVLLLGFVFNWLTAILSLATILFYSLFYTLLLKPNTPQNIVIGGAAGAMAPIGAWAAATNSIELTPVLLFLIIFLWTPPHFWALALLYKDDYRKAEYPMMPIAKGDDSTLNQMLAYTLVLVASSFALLFTGNGVGVIYAIAACVLGVQFINKVSIAKSQRSVESYRALFGYSIVYLFVLFIALIADSLCKPLTSYAMTILK